MRLSTDERKFLKNTIANISSDARLYLFGSRTDDTKKGGDIDLLIISKTLDKKDIRKLRVEFFKKFGEQKMDIVLDDGSLKTPFTSLIYKKAIEL